jgi:hypothetical protein
VWHAVAMWPSRQCVMHEDNVFFNGVHGPCTVVLAVSMMGDAAQRKPMLKTTLCAMWHIQEAASAMEGAVMHIIDVVSLGEGTMLGS